MVYDYSKLRGRIVECFGSIRAFSEALGISAAATYDYLNNHTPFNQRSIEKWCKLLKIPIEDAVVYFFTAKSLDDCTIKETP